MCEHETDSRPATWDPGAVRDWLLETGRFRPDLYGLVQGLGEFLRNNGAPVLRLRVSNRTLHPLTTAVSSVWELDPGRRERIETPHGLEKRPSYLGSPMQFVSETGKPFRRRLDETLGEDDHRILHELKERGATDYLALPMQLSDGKGAIYSMASDAAGGLSDEDIAAFNRICDVLAPIVDIYRHRHIAAVVAEAYLGQRTGQKVLDGRITRGDIETINAAILVSDIRDWTGLNTRLPADQALAAANRYFEVIAEAVEARGGEILKFIGDGVLAVFPTDDRVDDSQVCANALNASMEALAGARQADPPLEVDFGIGLHFGEVAYGNVGSKTRIDFTVLGSAVNIAARLEGLCREFQRPVLFSKAVADRLPEPADRLGEAVLKGMSESNDIFTLERAVGTTSD